MATEHQKGLSGLIIYSFIKKRKRKTKKRAYWTKQWLLDRDIFTHTNLLNESRLYPSDFHNYLMDEQTYMELLSLLTPFIEKEDTVMRAAIPPHERLTATLRFLTTGRSYEDLKYSTRISPQALGRIIPETCKAIYMCLAKEYLKLPQTAGEWLAIADAFEARWQFPNCLGAIDGKHIAISPPPGSGSFYLNYKKFFSMVLLGIANANYELIYVHFGTNGRVSDGDVIANTLFYDSLKSGHLNLPPQSSENGLPFVFVSDEAFALRTDLLKPYNVKVLDDQKRIFNYRLSRARRIIENVFGILVTRFGVLKAKMNLKPQSIEDVVLACCVLHNFLRRNAPDKYTPQGSFDTEDQDHVLQEGLRTGETNIAPIRRGATKNAADPAEETRDAFMEYFNNAGAVPWQKNFI